MKALTSMGSLTILRAWTMRRLWAIMPLKPSEDHWAVSRPPRVPAQEEDETAEWSTS